jgi:hypothetical protein
MCAMMQKLRVNSIAMKAPLCERAAIGSIRVKLAAFYAASLRGFSEKHVQPRNVSIVPLRIDAQIRS